MDFDAQKLEELMDLTRENNKILRSMRRSQRWNSFMNVAYWLLILGSVFGVYYYFQPTIQSYMKTVQNSIGILEQFQSAAASIPAEVQTAKNLIGK